MPLFKTQPYLVFIQDFCLGFCFVFFYKRDPFRNKGQVSQTSVGRALAFPSWGLLLTTASSFYLWLHLSCRQLGPALETWATEHPGCDQSWWPAPGVFPSWAFHSRCTYPSWACQPPASLPPLPTSAPAPWPAHPTSASRSPGRDRVGKGLKTTLSPYSTSPIASQAHRSRAPHKQSKSSAHGRGLARKKTSLASNSSFITYRSCSCQLWWASCFLPWHLVKTMGPQFGIFLYSM